MAAPRWLLVLLLLLLLGLALAAAGPLSPDGQDAGVGLVCPPVRPRGARRGAVQRPGGWRRSRRPRPRPRPRPRLSHKGPMPF